MTKQEFSQAFSMAKTGQDLTRFDDSPLHGCGLPDFGTVHTTVGAVARLVQWQCLCWDGSIDSVSLADMAIIARRKFLIVG
jgi:hypothetical protein